MYKGGLFLACFEESLVVYRSAVVLVVGHRYMPTYGGEYQEKVAAVGSTCTSSSLIETESGSAAALCNRPWVGHTSTPPPAPAIGLQLYITGTNPPPSVRPLQTRDRLVVRSLDGNPLSILSRLGGPRTT